MRMMLVQSRRKIWWRNNKIGTPAETLITAQYLNGKMRLEFRLKRREGNGKFMKRLAQQEITKMFQSICR
jgi:hypothetical protein